MIPPINNDDSSPQAQDPWFGDRREYDGFLPAVLDKTVIAIPLLKILYEEDQAAPHKDAPSLIEVIIDLSWNFPGGREAAEKRVERLLSMAISNTGVDKGQRIDVEKSSLSNQYFFASLEAPVIRELVRLDREDPPEPAPIEHQPGQGDPRPANRAIYSIWPDFGVKSLLTKSYVTVKADAARAAFSALGENITWAVIDSGIDQTHLHFQQHKNLVLDDTLANAHADFTRLSQPDKSPLTDEYGHGTHVAGIIAGEINLLNQPAASSAAMPAEPVHKPRIITVSRQRDENGNPATSAQEIKRISGMAPSCKLVSIKVLDEKGEGPTSNLIVALEHIHKINNYGRRIVIQGVNLSVGYAYDPEWFACGQSPLCVEVNRLVRSGVVVVVAAGNTGYGWLQAAFKSQPVSAGMDLSINDPGNAELAITVGSTHRESPHIYGVSYFSSKGPTGDGRLKPDLVAPGEKIISCASSSKRGELERTLSVGRDTPVGAKDAVYTEDSGTSMAAPHVSGAIAAFLSIRREFIGRPDIVKEIFLSTATDLKREHHFQGHGLVDLMRAIQSV